MRGLKNILLVLSTGYIFVYFSEHLFWARPRPGDTLQSWLGAWLAYSLLAFIFLVLVSHFRVKNIWALFLAGAVFGWLAEGLVVQTAYEQLPLSISFTGLAWHALLTVWIGWYATRKTLLSHTGWPTLILAAAIGLGYSLWAISWWLEPDGGVSSVPEFAAYSFLTTVLAVLAYGLASWSASEPFAPNRWVTGLIGGVFILYFFFVTVPAAPLALILLPALIGLAIFGLRRNRLAEGEGSLLENLAGDVPVWKYLRLLALPLVATLCYALASSLDLHWRTNWILYLIATPLGFILFGISLHQALTKKVLPPGG